jgi:Undecaprenyl-phosphate galactose phosphotransferase WbaP
MARAPLPARALPARAPAKPPVLALAATTEVPVPRKRTAPSLHRSRSKRLFDIIGACALLVFFAPLIGLLYILIRRDGGPTFYAHSRVGVNGTRFRCWKFRTMIVDADKALAELLARDAKAAAQWRKDFKLKDDPRITRVGAILRAFSFDELPQLWNVLLGDMSLVGPRPIVREEMLRYGANIIEYLGCRPGLTGLWQVSGRNDVSYRRRVALDTYYATHWSLGLDLLILLKTAGVVLNRSGAY